MFDTATLRYDTESSTKAGCRHQYRIASNPTVPPTFVKFAWHRTKAKPDNNQPSDLWVCTVCYFASSDDEAAGLTNFSSTNLTTGCGGFPWSHFLPRKQLSSPT